MCGPLTALLRNDVSPEKVRRGALILFAALTLTASLSTPAWTRESPVVWRSPGKAEAALQAFERELESHDSATDVLQAWCDAHGSAPGLKITARPVKGARKRPPPPARLALRLRPGGVARYRRVDLMCGDRVLSQADNWYLPGRLTDEMNRQLDRTSTPFGVVVKPLNFTRRNLTTEILFRGGAAVPPQVLRHSAVLLTGDGAPFSFVVETYTDAILTVGP